MPFDQYSIFLVLGDQFLLKILFRDRNFVAKILPALSCCFQEEVVDSPDVHFEPLVKLPPMELKTMEEGEEELFKM